MLIVKQYSGENDGFRGCGNSGTNDELRGCGLANVVRMTGFRLKSTAQKFQGLSIAINEVKLTGFVVVVN